jgi:hypothetical protein
LKEIGMYIGTAVTPSKIYVFQRPHNYIAFFFYGKCIADVKPLPMQAKRILPK